MNKTLSLATASMLILGVSSVFHSTSTQATEVDCVNYWVNPESNLTQCFDSELNYTPVPFRFLSNTPTVSSDKEVRRRATDSNKMIMPDLIGSEIDDAEDYLLSMGVTLGSKEVHVQNKTAGEVTQQTPLPGTKLEKGQTVLLQYMGATINPIQVK